jgi:hypothetical protein
MLPAGPGAPHVGGMPSMPMQFIPHQIQRQLPTQRGPAQATFVPATAHQSNLYNPNVNSNQPPQVNYTVTPMQVPTLVHNIPSTSGQSSGAKVKTKNPDKGLLFIMIILIMVYYMRIIIIHYRQETEKGTTDGGWTGLGGYIFS